MWLLYHKKSELHPLKDNHTNCISSICKYRLSTFITSNGIIPMTITYNTLLIHRWTTNTSAIPRHFYITHDTSDIDILLHVKNVLSLGSPCQSIYISFLNPASAGNYQYWWQNIKFYITFSSIQLLEHQMWFVYLT